MALQPLPPNAPPSAHLQQTLTGALETPQATGSLGQGFSNLLQILQSQGQVDPRQRNRALTNVRRGAEAQQVGQAQSSAQRGLQNSGALQAINAAIGASGEDRAAAVDADFVAQGEQRKRQDLMLLLQLIMNPSLQQQGITNNALLGRASIDQQNRGATIGALSSLGGGIFSNPNIFGGDGD